MAAWDLGCSGIGTVVECVGMVNGVMEKSTNVMNEEGVEELGYFLFVGKFEGAFEGYPHAFEMHRSDFHYVLLLLTLEDSITAASCHTNHIQELSAIDHVVIFSSGNTSPLDINLKTKRALILP